MLFDDQRIHLVFFFFFCFSFCRPALDGHEVYLLPSVVETFEPCPPIEDDNIRDPLYVVWQ